jgi:hypothetical protein
MTGIVRTTASPFDVIKLEDASGDYWSARDLMPLLGYEKWERFEDAIERAISAVNNSGHDAPDHIRGTGKMVKIGSGTERKVIDYRLTRFGAYMVAMNSDPRKNAVAKAQTYFAVKTREAESALVNPKEITRADMARMILAAEEELAVVTAALESATPAIEYHERYVITDDVVIVKVWGAQFGLTEPEAFELLRSKNLIYRVQISERWSVTRQRKVPEFEHRARAGKQSFAWFDLRPQHTVARHHNGQVRQTLYVRQAYALDLGRAAGLVPQIVPA